MFGTKKALFLELVGAAFDRFSDGMAHAAAGASGLDALALMGAQYYESLADRTTLLLQLQGFAACGDSEVRDLVRARLGPHVGHGRRDDRARPGDGEVVPGLRHAAQ